MKDENKTKAQLINDIKALKKEISELRTVDSRHKRDDLVRKTFAHLGLELAKISTLKELAISIAKAVDILFDYDAFFFSQRLPGSKMFEIIYAEDIIDGNRQFVETRDMSEKVYRPMGKLLKGIPFLLNRDLGDDARDWIRFGDESRPSASLMFSPVCFDKEVCGLISVQSYQPQCYSKPDLELLKNISDSVAPALRRVQTENTLRESEEKYRLLVENVNDGIVISQKDKFIFFNNRFAEMLGYRSEELLMKDYKEVYTLQSIEILKKRELKRNRGEKVPPRYETIFRKKDGSELYVEANVSIINYHNELATFAVIRDITERKKNEMIEEAFILMGEKLTSVRGIKEAAKIIFDTADKLWGWDACTLDLYDADQDKMYPVFNMDIINGKKVEVPSSLKIGKPTPRMDRILKEGPLLIDRSITKNKKTDSIMFGNKTRLSASIMCVPIRKESKAVGVLSIQSYIPKAYVESDLKMLQAFADYCGGALERIRIEQELHESQEQFTTFMYYLPAGVFIKDRDCRILYVNKYLEDVFEAKNWINRRPDELFQEEIAQRIITDDCEAMSKGPLEIVESLPDSKGEKRFFQTHKFPIIRKDKPIMLGGIALDITERNKAEIDLRNSEAKSRALLSAIPDLMFQIQKDATFTDYRGSTKGLYLPPEDFLGKKVFDVLPEEIAQKIMYNLERVLETGNMHFYEYELMVEGDKRYYEARMVPCGKDEVLCIVRNISEQRRAAEEREALRRFSQRLTEPLTLEEVGKVVAEECTRLFHYDAFSFSYYDEKKKMSIGVYTEDTPAGAEKPINVPSVNLPMEVFKKSQVYTGKSILINRKDDTEEVGFTPFGDKERLSRSLMFVPIRWASRVIGVITVQSYAKDCYTETDLKLLETFASQCGGALIRVRTEEEHHELQSRIQQAQKLESLGVLTGGIAHDFNNLLVGILGNANMALMELSPTSPVKSTLEQIEKAGQRAAELCRQMLTYSGKGQFVMQPIDLIELVKDMSHLLEFSISKKAVLKYNFGRNIPAIDADATQIRQIVMNLITNASDAVDDISGVVNITVGVMECDQEYLNHTYLDENLQEGCYVYLEVSDTGCGMNEETKAKIFDPFFTTKFTGRGLGLAATLGIVRSHNGAIKVYSEPGRGTTFKILFPCSKKQALRSIDESTALGDWKGSGTVLLVDDEETVRILAKRVLEKVGFTVLIAKNGLEGVELYRKKCDEITLVILDMTMPHLDGEETFREMRRIKKDVCVILSSGYNEQDTTDRFAGKGLAGFIQKPYRPSDLINKIRSIFEKK